MSHDARSEPGTESPTLEALLEDLRSGADRAGAAKALGRLGDARAAGPLVQTLGDNNHAVRYAAGRALRRLGAERVLAPKVSAQGPAIERPTVAAIPTTPARPETMGFS